MRGPAAAFSDPPRGLADEPIPTIGHIGRYALKHRLGEGGLGTVYAAHDPLLSRLIAVKTLHVEIDDAEREAFNALFLNEARAAAGLSHPHIVTVFDAGISDNRAYIAMELLKGRDLRQLRQEGWRATPAQAALIVRRVADALGYAHSKGVVHRDIKPANIFMIGRTQPKVLDFGIARVAHRHDAQAPGGDIAAGSPYYMAPEQVRQQPADRRADVFSLGVVLYELLTDLKPFRGATLEEITTAVLTHEPSPANVVDPAVPEALAAIAAKAIAKEPEHRHRSARAFSRELRQWLDENTVNSDGDSPTGSSPKQRIPWIAAAALGALVIGALLWATRASNHGAAPAVPAASAAAPAAANASSVAVGATASAASGPIGAVGAATMTPPPASSPDTHAAAAPGAAPAKAVGVAARASNETAKEKRAREARERAAKAAPPAAAPAPVPNGLVRIAISPWGEVEVDGKPAGTAPPLTELSLPQGKHQIVIRNTDLPPQRAVVNVTADQPVSLKFRF
ncbi:MAG: serine/threonine protein kinase [Burkholderiales bacterium]|nr:serine/threonine protein kinase [Burkholderiales bacterium]